MNSLAKYWIGACIVLMLVLNGCGEKEPEEKLEEAPPPPPPSAQEIFNELDQVANIMFFPKTKNVNAGKAQQDEITKKMQDILQKHVANPNLSQAKANFAAKTEGIIVAEKQRERWQIVKGACVAFKVVAPESQRYKKVEEEADLILARPITNLDGFIDVAGETNVFFRVLDEGTYTKYQVREGEEFHEVFQLVRIIGDQQAVEILYKPMDSTYIVKGPKERRSGTSS